jgi:hypothetical protein
MRCTKTHKTSIFSACAIPPLSGFVSFKKNLKLEDVQKGIYLQRQPTQQRYVFALLLLQFYIYFEDVEAGFLATL